jgi:hypothetical protein
VKTKVTRELYILCCSVNERNWMTWLYTANLEICGGMRRGREKENAPYRRERDTPTVKK